MGKLIYLTNIQAPAGDAQSIQVQAMAQSFGNILGDNFIFVSPKNKLNEKLSSDFRWIKLKTGGKISRNLRYFLVTLKSLSIILKEKPDIIFSRDIGVVFIYRLLGIETCYEIHKPFETKMGKFFFKLIAQKIKIVSISDNLKNYIIEKYNLERENILVAHDGVFLKDFEKIKLTKKELKKKYLGLEEKDFVVLYSGSLQRGKGIDLILDTAYLLEKVFFVIIGGKENEIEQLKKRKFKNIIFLGRKPHQDIPHYLKSADLLILPSNKKLSYWQYTSPLKLFEYMASGNPILASEIGSIKDILNGNNAFFFNPEDINNLVNKIKFIEKNYGKAETKAEKSLEDIKNYTWKKRANKILDFLS